MPMKASATGSSTPTAAPPRAESMKLRMTCGLTTCKLMLPNSSTVSRANLPRCGRI